MCNWRFVFYVFLMIVIWISGCSSGSSPTIPDSSKSLPYIESAAGLDSAADVQSGIGIMGAFHLNINPVQETAELITKRSGAIGESYLVSGLGFFTSFPCVDCLKLIGFSLEGRNVNLGFHIRHPFEQGNPALPPSGKNRLDLDVFDVALVVAPIDRTPTNFPLTGVDVYSDVLDDYVYDGYPVVYTREVSAVTGDDTAMPAILIRDDSESAPPATWNKFAMGSETDFEVPFILTPGVSLSFDMYLTMGYGASAKKATRLTPKYYNPEFNRKAAWKVEVRPQGPVLYGDLTPTIVEIRVWDWQTGATMYYDQPNFQNAPPDNVYSYSDVESVEIEIIGLSLVGTTPISGTGMPHDPLIYNIPVSNTNDTEPGTYTGLVKVLDQCLPSNPISDRYFLIHTSDGITLTNHVIPEYATYQVFDIEVIQAGVTIEQVNYNLDGTITNDSSHGDVTYGYVGQPNPQYFNLGVNGNWVIQNVVILPYAGVGAPQSESMEFDLGVPDGTDVSLVIGGWDVGDMPHSFPPTETTYFPVGDCDVIMCSGITGSPLVLQPPPLLIGTTVVDYACDGRFMPNQDLISQELECVPAAVSNSLQYLRDKYGKPPAGKKISKEAMKAATAWTSDGSPLDWPATKDAFMKANGFGIKTTVVSGPVGLQIALDEYKKGQDVEITGWGPGIGGHCGVVVGISRLSDGRWLFSVAHDRDQTNKGGTRGDDTVTYDPTTEELEGGGFDGMGLLHFTIECPE